METIVECGVVFLSLRKAERIVPPEFIEAYKWFMDPKNEKLKQLPFGEGTPKEFAFPLARQAGIFSPDYRNLPSRGAGKKNYVLSVHSDGQKYYDDEDAVYREDGTWVLEYCAYKAQEGKHGAVCFNEAMMNNLRDGVPVAVIVKEADGYRNLGLAFIEQYNSISDVFSLHGPVNEATESASSFTFVEPDQLSKKDNEILLAWDELDERKHVISERISRECQFHFREKVSIAYSGCCALTEVDVPQVLQAAHIDAYCVRRPN